jgi:hypothetical protein
VKNSPSLGRDLPPLEFEDTDFPNLPARVPAGEHLDGPLGDATWQYFNTPQEERERVHQILTGEAFVRAWSATEPMGLES